MSILLKAIYRFSTVSLKIPVAFATEIEQTILELIRDHKTAQMAKSNLEK